MTGFDGAVIDGDDATFDGDGAAFDDDNEVLMGPVRHVGVGVSSSDGWISGFFRDFCLKPFSVSLSCFLHKWKSEKWIPLCEEVRVIFIVELTWSQS